MLRDTTYLCFNSSSHCTLIRYTSTYLTLSYSIDSLWHVWLQHSTGKNRPEPHPHCRLVFEFCSKLVWKCTGTRPTNKMKRRQDEEAPIPEEIKRSRLKPSPKESPVDQYQRRRKWRSWSVEEVSAFLLANELPEEVARKFERELLFSARMNSERSVSPCKKARACDPFGGGLTTGRLGGPMIFLTSC